jgi:hypothetical protein
VDATQALADAQARLGGVNLDGTPRRETEELSPSRPDTIHLPMHYARWEIEPVHFIMVNDLPFWLGNIIKYGMRYDAKNGIEDLKKARRYLDMKIAQLEGDEEFWK